MAGNFQAPPRVKTGLDEYKLRLSAPPSQGATKPASLAFSLVANQPRIDVYTNVPNDKQNGNIRAAMDAPTFWALIEALKIVIDGEAGQKISIPNKNYTWWEGKRSDEPKLVSTTIVGKDKEGVVFISVVAKDRPFIKFPFLPSLFHTLVKADGSGFTDAEMSILYAKGYAKNLPMLYASVSDTHYQEPKPKDGAGGGQGGQGGYQRSGGGQQRSSGGGGGQSRQSSDSFDDDDFPM